MRSLLLSLALLAAAAPISAQVTHDHDPDDAVAGGGGLPAGWHARLDQASASIDNVKFMAMGGGYHVTLGPAAIFYNESHRASGEYTARVTIAQNQAPRHPEAYGIIVGGRDLQAANQDYLYFLVRQDGKFLIKHRAGAETHNILDWTDHAAVRKPDPQGRASNTLAVEVGASDVRFLVNGTEVRRIERAPYLNTDGIVGIRVNHNLDVMVTGLAVEQKMTMTRGGGG